MSSEFAAKHGALSTEHGSLDVLGEMQDDRLILAWAETGGPLSPTRPS